MQEMKTETRFNVYDVKICKNRIKMVLTRNRAFSGLFRVDSVVLVLYTQLLSHILGLL